MEFGGPCGADQRRPGHELREHRRFQFPQFGYVRPPHGHRQRAGNPVAHGLASRRPNARPAGAGPDKEHRGRRLPVLRAHSRRRQHAGRRRAQRHLQHDGWALLLSLSGDAHARCPRNADLLYDEQRRARRPAGGQQHYLQRHDGHGDDRGGLRIRQWRHSHDHRRHARGVRRRFPDHGDRNQHLHLHLAPQRRRPTPAERA